MGMKYLALSIILFAEKIAVNAIGSSTWHFLGGDVSHHFVVDSLTFPQNGWTLEMWVYPLEDAKGKWWLSFASEGSEPGNKCFMQPASSFTADTWQHIIMTWDGQANRIFFDGAEQPIGAYSASKSCIDKVGTLTIGQEQVSTEGTFDVPESPGMFLDSVALYSRAWDANEVALKAANTCVDMDSPEVFAAWFTEDGKDSTGNGHSASIVPDHSGGGFAGGVTSVISTEGIFGYCASGACFHANSTVLLESGTSKTFANLRVGDVIKTSDGEGSFSFNPVIALPHAQNDDTTVFVSLTTETGKTIIMTPDHYIPTCEEGKEETAGELVVGDCVFTVDGKETLTEISSTQKSGVYTATTDDTFIVVNGIVASPFSRDSRRVAFESASSTWDFKTTLKSLHLKALASFKKRLRGSR